MEGSHTQPHKTPNYVGIFVWLIVITAAEVGLGYVPHTVLPQVVTYPVLLIMAVIKALLVALYYMHLRYDSRWFLLVAATSLPLGIVFVLAMVLGFAPLAP